MTSTVPNLTPSGLLNYDGRVAQTKGAPDEP
jgi:hypothetical protein